VLGSAAAWLFTGGCKNEKKAVGGDDVNVLLTSPDGSERLAASKRLAARGESVLPALLEAFGKTQGKAEAQLSLADAVFRMPPSSATIAALEKMAEQATDAAKGPIDGWAQQQKARR